MSFVNDEFTDTELQQYPWLEYIVRAKIAIKAFRIDKTEAAKKLKDAKDHYEHTIQDSVWNRQHPLREYADKIIDLESHLIFLNSKEIDVLIETIDSLIQKIRVANKAYMVQSVQQGYASSPLPRIEPLPSKEDIAEMNLVDQMFDDIGKTAKEDEDEGSEEDSDSE